MIKPFGIVTTVLFLEPVAYVYACLDESDTAYIVADIARQEFVNLKSVEAIQTYVADGYRPQAEARFQTITVHSPYFLVAKQAYEKLRMFDERAQKPQWAD